jgi:hypothetical protein
MIISIEKKKLTKCKYGLKIKQKKKKHGSKDGRPTRVDLEPYLWGNAGSSV